MKRTRPFLMLCVLLLVEAALVDTSPHAFRAQSSPRVANPSYYLYCGLWRVDNGLVSTIHVKNALTVAPLDVTPILYMSDGREYDLPPVHLATAATLDINVNDALSKIPQTIHPSEHGSAALRYEYMNPGHLLASMEVINLHRSMVFDYPFNSIDEDMIGPHSMEAVWWKHDPAVGGFVALTNVTGGWLSVDVQAVDSTGQWAGSQTFGLQPHSIQILHLNALAADFNGPENQSGGLRLQYNGAMGALIVSGGLVNERQGYTAGIPFWYHDPDPSTPKTLTYASVGLMIGRPDAAMGFPRSTEFAPYAVLRNTTANPISVKMTMNYMVDQEPVSVPLPVAPLAPYETRRVDLPAILGKLGLGDFRGDANLLFSFTGHAGDLVIATGSVDQTENYVFVVEPQGVGRSLGKASHYWTSAHGFDTMYSLYNPTDRPQDFFVTIYYGDGSGSYRMPVHLDAQASMMTDMAMLIGENRADVHGKNFPAGVQQGSVVIESAKGESQWMTLVVSSGVYNPLRGTCTVNCITCYGYSGFCVVANPFAVPVTSTTPLHANATYSDGNVHDYTSSSSWRSDNTSVATVGASTGVVTGQAPGSLNAYATFPSLIVTTGQVCSGGTPVCPTGTPSPGAPGNAINVNQSPSQFNMSTGDTRQITASIQPSTLNVNVSFGQSRFENPNSSCGATLNIPSKSGAGSLTQNVTASSAGCSGAFTVVASASGASANSPTTVYVPPQVLIQMMQAEAGGTGNSSLMQDLGEVARNRFSSSFFDPPFSNFQNAIVPGQFATSATTTGIEPELDPAVTVFLNDTPDACGSLAFWTPTPTQWQNVQAAWTSGTTNFPSGTGAPTYQAWSISNQQIVYISTVGTQGNGAPNFLFLTIRSPSDHAVVSGVCP